MASAVKCATLQERLKHETAIFVGTHQTLSFSVAEDLDTFLCNAVSLGIAPLLNALQGECSKAPPSPAVLRALHQLSDGVRATMDARFDRKKLRKELVAIGKRVSAQTSKAMSRSPFFVFAYADESMDIAMLETLMLCYSFVHPDTFEFVVVLGEVLDMSDGTTGLHVLNAICDSARRAGVLVRLVGGSSDGHSNMCAEPRHAGYKSSL